MSTAESPPFALKHLKSGREPFGRTRIFKGGNGRELNDYDGFGASGCGLRQSGWALEHRGLRWDGFGCSRAFVDRLRPRDCWGLGETTDDSPSLVSVSKSSAPPCPAGLDLVSVFDFLGVHNLANESNICSKSTDLVKGFSQIIKFLSGSKN